MRDNMRKKPGLLRPVLLAAAFLTAATPIQAFAREKIEQVTLNFTLNTDTDDWSDLVVECGDDGYEVRTINLFPNGQAASTYPYAVVVLDAGEDYYFSSIKSKYFTLEGEGASFQEASRSNSNSTMTLQVRLRNLGEGQLEPPTGLIWSDTGVASWESVAGAGNYSIRLRRNGEAIGSSTSAKTENNVYNLSTKITQTGTYEYQVRANGRYKKTKSSDWVTSGSIEVDEAKLAYIKENASEDTGLPGQWYQADDGRYWYQYATGNVPKNEWREIDDNFYFFDPNGYMAVSQWIGNYYVGEDGKMLKDTVTPDGYYVDENGAWAPKG